MKHFLLSVLLLTGGAVNAQLLKDNFSSYTTGNDLNNQGGWSNNTSNPGGGGNCAGATCTNQKVSATALSFNSYGTSSKSVNGGPGKDACGRGWTTNVTSGSVYVSFLVNFSDVTCDGSCSAFEWGFFRLIDRSSNFTTVVRMLTKKTTSGSFQFGVEKASNGAASRVYTTSSINFNTTHLVVLKYTINAGGSSDDIVKLYVNPDMSQPEPAVADITTNLGNDASATIDIAAASFNYNSSVDRMPVGNYGLLTVAAQWNQLPHTVAAVPVIDRDIQQVKIFTTSSSQAVLQMNSNKTDALTIEVMDAMGRVVLKQTEKLQQGRNQFLIETSKLPAGVYNVRAFGSKGVTPTVRFVK